MGYRPWGRKESDTTEQLTLPTTLITSKHAPVDIEFGDDGDRRWKGQEISHPPSTTWRGEWLPTPVFLPGESHGQRSLVGKSRYSIGCLYLSAWLHLPEIRT